MEDHLDLDGLDQLFTVTDYQTIVVPIPFGGGGSVGNGGCPKPVPKKQTVTAGSEVIVTADNNNNKSPEGDETVSTNRSNSSNNILSVELFASRQATTDFDRTGQILWPVSILLSHYLASPNGLERLVVNSKDDDDDDDHHHPTTDNDDVQKKQNKTTIRRRNIVELGAGGTALPSLTLATAARALVANEASAKLPPVKIVATDGNGDVVLDLLKQNIDHFNNNNDNMNNNKKQTAAVAAEGNNNIGAAEIESTNQQKLLYAHQLVWGDPEQLQQVLQTLGDDDDDDDDDGPTTTLDVQNEETRADCSCDNITTTSSKPTAPVAAAAAADVVVAADVVQWPQVLEPLLHTVRALLWHSPLDEPLFLLGIVNRASSTYNNFFDLARQMQFTVRKINLWQEVFAWQQQQQCNGDGDRLEGVLRHGDGDGSISEEQQQQQLAHVIPESCREYGGRETELYELRLVDPDRKRTRAAETAGERKLPLLLSLLQQQQQEQQHQQQADWTVGSEYQQALSLLPC